MFIINCFPPKKCEQSANIRTIRSHLLLKCEQLFALKFYKLFDTDFQYEGGIGDVMDEGMRSVVEILLSLDHHQPTLNTLSH